jgi:hypothetical protein
MARAIRMFAVLAVTPACLVPLIERSMAEPGEYIGAE